MEYEKSEISGWVSRSFACVVHPAAPWVGIGHCDGGGEVLYRIVENVGRENSGQGRAAVRQMYLILYAAAPAG